MGVSTWLFRQQSLVKAVSHSSESQMNELPFMHLHRRRAGFQALLQLSLQSGKKQNFWGLEGVGEGTGAPGAGLGWAIASPVNVALMGSADTTSATEARNPGCPLVGPERQLM